MPYNAAPKLTPSRTHKGTPMKLPSYPESTFQFLLPLVVSDVDVYAMQPCLQGGLAEALHAVHSLARRAEHGELLPVRRTLARGSVITKGLFTDMFSSFNALPSDSISSSSSRCG